MIPAQQNLTVHRGTDWSVTLRWKSGGVVVNLTGYTAVMEAKLTHRDADPVFRLTDEDGITLGGAAGTIIPALTAAQTAEITAHRLVYDLLLIAPSGAIGKRIEGEISVRPTVSTP